MAMKKVIFMQGPYVFYHEYVPTDRLAVDTIDDPSSIIPIHLVSNRIVEAKHIVSEITFDTTIKVKSMQDLEATKNAIDEAIDCEKNIEVWCKDNGYWE